MREFIQRGLQQMQHYLFWAGINLLALSVLIFLFPEIVAYAIAFLLGIAGIGLLMYAWRMRRRQKDNYTQTTYYTYNRF